MQVWMENLSLLTEIKGAAFINLPPTLEAGAFDRLFALASAVLLCYLRIMLKTLNRLFRQVANYNHTQIC